MTGTAPRPVRAAFFTDSFHEVNGVANVSRRLEAYARDRGLPFFSAHAGPEPQIARLDSVTRLELQRGKHAWQLDTGLTVDPMLWRRHEEVIAPLREFQPDLVHITGPGDIGILGMILAKRLRVPLVISWHTNLHEYAGRRVERLLRVVPRAPRRGAAKLAERAAMAALVKFYREARIMLAPNQDLVKKLSERTGRFCSLMQRGVDTELFQPSRRRASGETLNLGYVGRLSPEKNVQLFATLEQTLRNAGSCDYRFTIVGQGSEREWLERRLARARFTGVLRGEELARAYADMDLFVFPSNTDAFGNVVLEAMACGTPALVMARGGPQYLLRDGVSGFVARDEGEFIAITARLVREPEHLRSMRGAARTDALRLSWDEVLSGVFEAYRTCMNEPCSAVQPALK